MSESINNSIQETKKTFIWRKASAPMALSFCAFICFIIIYWMCTVRSINPLYVKGLYFIIPSLIFALIAYLAGKNKLGTGTTYSITILLIPILLFVSFFYLIFLSLEESSVTITSVSKYERTINFGENPNKEQLIVFPKKLPDDAKNITFYYYEAVWMDYSQTVALKFSADVKTIDNYTKQVKSLAIQTEPNIKIDWARVGYGETLPADYIVYVIFDNSIYKACIVAISQERNNIIFYAREMRP